MFWNIFEEYITPIGLSLVAILLMVLIVIEVVAIIRDKLQGTGKTNKKYL